MTLLKDALAIARASRYAGGSGARFTAQAMDHLEISGKSEICPKRVEVSCLLLERASNAGCSDGGRTTGQRAASADCLAPSSVVHVSTKLSTAVKSTITF